MRPEHANTHLIEEVIKDLNERYRPARKITVGMVVEQFQADYPQAEVPSARTIASIKRRWEAPEAPPSNHGTGLLLVMMDIDPEHEDDFNRWYDDEHVPERMSIPGFLTGRRYRAIEGGPKYLAIYEMESPEVLDSPAYRYASGQGRSEWTAQVVGRAKNYVRNVYVEMVPGEHA